MEHTTLTHLRDASGALRELSIPGLLLEVLKGPDVRHRKTCAQEKILIGTADGNELKLTDATVSAFHCELRVTTAGCRVIDLGSKNGVILGSRRVLDAFIEPDDQLRLGASVVRVRATQDRSSTPIEDVTSFGSLLGSSVTMRIVFERLARIAKSDESVLVTGETGTGKELAAEAIVNAGTRASRPIVIVDCARQGTELFEAELFGHAKGAFTGATADVAGAFERANGGTLVLDQVCELPMSMQPKLLGVLERRIVQRMGGGSAPFDVRVIATSRKQLGREINRGTFRSDLYYRLAVLQAELPPLRDHPEDIPQLVAHFCKELGITQALPPHVLEQLYEGDYPGNVRELKNAVARAAFGVMPGLPQGRVQELDLDVPFWTQRERAMAALEVRYLTQLLEGCDGNLSLAARKSKISRVHLYAMLRKHGLGDPKRGA